MYSRVTRGCGQGKDAVYSRTARMQCRRAFALLVIGQLGVLGVAPDEIFRQGRHMRGSPHEHRHSIWIFGKACRCQLVAPSDWTVNLNLRYPILASSGVAWQQFYTIGEHRFLQLDDNEPTLVATN